MTLLIKCDRCGETRQREEKRPEGWTTDFDVEPRKDLCDICSAIIIAELAGFVVEAEKNG